MLDVISVIKAGRGQSGTGAAAVPPVTGVTAITEGLLIQQDVVWTMIGLQKPSEVSVPLKGLIELVDSNMGH